MEIILKKTIDNLGREGDVVKVKPGYARNYLLPQKMAQFVTPATLRQLELEKAAIAERLALEKKATDTLAAKLNGITVIINRMAGDGGRLFGSVTSSDIAEYLAAQGVVVDKKSINLPAPIKSLGESKFTIKAGYQTSVAMTVQVMPELSGDAPASNDKAVASDNSSAANEAATE